MSTACPSRQQLLDYAVGKLDEPALDEVSQHVEQCATCQSLLSTLDDSGDTVLLRLRHAPVLTGFEHEPEYQQAVAAAKAVVPGAAAVIPPSAAAAIGSWSDEDDQALPSEREATESLAGAPESAADDGPAQELPELDDYELLEKLGQGGMGAVYKARHKKLKRIMAIKLLPKERLANPTALARFEREMEAVGAVDHPNIVRAMHAGEHDGTPYLAVEYVDGLNLSDVVTRVGPLRSADACELVRQTAVGLQHAHEQGLVHRDIKPSNLMLAWAGRHVAESLRDSRPPVSERPGYVGNAPREEKPETKPTPPAPPPAKTETVARSAPPHAEREGYFADAAWTPGPLYNVLPGFIPRPTKLPGIKRWQVISTAPRDFFVSIDWSAAGLIACVSRPNDVRIYDAATLELKA